MVYKITFNVDDRDSDFRKEFYIASDMEADLLCQRFGYENLEDTYLSSDVKVEEIEITSILDIVRLPQLKRFGH